METKVLTGRVDLYNGVIIDVDSLPNTDEEFQEILKGKVSARSGFSHDYGV